MKTFDWGAADATLTRWRWDELENDTISEVCCTATGRPVARIYYPDGAIVEHPLPVQQEPVPRFDTTATVEALRKVADGLAEVLR